MRAFCCCFLRDVLSAFLRGVAFDHTVSGEDTSREPATLYRTQYSIALLCLHLLVHNDK